MFKGIIYDIGKISGLSKTSDGMRIKISCDSISDISEGDSIAIDGVCLTLTKKENNNLFFDVMNETVSITKLKSVKIGDEVNIEKSLKFGDTIDGHIVSGHIDCVGVVEGVTKDGFAKIISINANEDCLQQLVYKGSVALNGVSLTLIEVSDKSLKVSVIPKTLELTNFSNLKKGDAINIEIDMFSKYIKKYLDNRGL